MVYHQCTKIPETLMGFHVRSRANKPVLLLSTYDKRVRLEGDKSYSYCARIAQSSRLFHTRINKKSAILFVIFLYAIYSQ